MSQIVDSSQPSDADDDDRWSWARPVVTQAESDDADSSLWDAQLDDSSIGIAEVDEHEQVLRANPAFAQVIGGPSRQALEPDSPLSQWANRFSASALQPLKRILARGEASSIQLQDADYGIVMIQVAELRHGRRLVVAQEISRHAVAVADHVQNVQIDPLTGLGNRLALEAAVDRLNAEANAEQHTIAISILDLDRFKHVNETLGHGAGDTLLKLVAKRLRAVIRSNEAVIRMGGDEFVILHTQGLNRKGAQSVGQRLIELISRPFLIEGHQVNIGASVGVAMSQQGINQSSEMLKRADLALYEAKAFGRSTYRIFENHLAERAEKRRALEVDLRRALSLRQFLLHYQPQISLVDGSITGFEALIRWHHPTRGMVSPGEFIPLAEEIGEIHSIGEWTIHEACREARGWPNDLAVAVNVSALQFQQGDIVATVREALARSGLAPQRLEIEITESLLLGHSERLRETFWELRALGVGIAMDDFGTGYSSLSYLNSFPFSKLKIDQSFVQSADQVTSSALIKAILNLGASLGMTTIAEGIETPHQYRKLADDGCASAQGFLISRPMPRGEIAEYLSRGAFQLTH